MEKETPKEFSENDRELFLDEKGNLIKEETRTLIIASSGSKFNNYETRETFVKQKKEYVKYYNQKSGLYVYRNIWVNIY